MSAVNQHSLAVRLAAENPEKYWHCNQFENVSNFNAHFTKTGPEIWQQMNGKIDYYVSAAGTGGTIAGNSCFLKSQDPSIKVILADPAGSILFNYVKHGEMVTNPGNTIAEGLFGFSPLILFPVLPTITCPGIGIARIVPNFKRVCT